MHRLTSLIMEIRLPHPVPLDLHKLIPDESQLTYLNLTLHTNRPSWTVTPIQYVGSFLRTKCVQLRHLVLDISWLDLDPGEQGPEVLFHLQDGISFEKCPCLEALHLVLFMGNAVPRDTSTQWGYGTKLLSTAHGRLKQLIIGIQTRIGGDASDDNLVSRENDVPWRMLDAAIVSRLGLRVQFQRRVEEGRPGRFVSPEERRQFGPAWVRFLQRMLPSTHADGRLDVLRSMSE